MKVKKINIMSIILFLVFICFLSSTKSALAAETKSYDISKGNIAINKSGNYIITGKTNKNTILIKKGVSTNITLRDVEISTDTVKASILIESGAAANFILKGENKISNTSEDGIHVTTGGKFIISSYSTGSIEVAGGLIDAGIGGGGTIIIKGGTVTAIGGQEGYGIGWGNAYQLYLDYKEEAGSITISGGKVTAIGGKEAAGGIGYSSKASTGIINITGGTVYATSGGSGIGNHSFEGKGNKITISGGNVTAIGNAYGTGIGNNLKPDGTTVTITGGTVKANGNMGTDMYDSWSYSNDNRLRKSEQVYDIAAKSITITGGQIFTDTCSVQPKNSEGLKLYHMIISSEKGKITKITAYQKNYGSKDINSKGILSLWLPEQDKPEGKPSLDVTFSSGKHTKRDYLSGYGVLLDYNSSKDMVFDLSSSDLEVYEHGFIYNNTIYSKNIYDGQLIKVTGSTSDHKIIVHSGKHRFEFENITVDYRNQTDQMFFAVRGKAEALINSKNQNTIKTGGKSVGFYVGNNAKLSFVSNSIENKLTLESYDDSYGVVTANGSIQQLGGSISIKAHHNSNGMYLGNEGAFSLYGGKIDGISSTTYHAIYGLNYMKVNVFGGIMNVDNIGYREEGNEEVADKSTFTLTNGEVNASNRMIFNTFEVTGGTINAHLLGSGSGSRIIMYQGKIVMDKFITDVSEPYYNEETNDFVLFEYITPEGVSKESALDTSTIYGGDIVETHNVTVEELKKISIGRA